MPRPAPRPRHLPILELGAPALVAAQPARRADSPSRLTANSKAVARLKTVVARTHLVIDAARADRLAAESFVFNSHFSQIPLTAASTVSLSTSQSPDTHGVFHRAEPDTATFDDVPTDYWCGKCIEYCGAESIVQGCSPTTYGPTALVTRDQMPVFITRAFDQAP